MSATEETVQQSAVRKMDASVVSGFDTAGGFELMMRIAKAFAYSTIVPQEYQAKYLQKAKKQSDGSWLPEQWVDNPSAISNCTIATNMALRMGSDPMMVMQNLVIVHGRPTWSAKFLIATVNASKRFSALRFVFSGKEHTDTWSCKAVATELSTGVELEGITITIKLAKAEGWYEKKGSKWQTMPQKMLMYRAGAWWCDLYSPELAMGLRTEDEVLDAFDTEQDINGTYTVASSSATAVIKDDPYVLGNTLKAIQDASSIIDLNNIDLSMINKKDLDAVSRKIRSKADEFVTTTASEPVAEKKEANHAKDSSLNWENKLRACESDTELKELLKSIPLSLQMDELSDVIQEMEEMLR